MSGGVALLAGGAPAIAVGIGVAMTLLQLGIGTTNDLVDAPRDAGRKPGKPIPAGLVPVGPARALAVAWFAAGVGLAVVIAPVAGVLAIVVIAIGLAYDLRLKGTAWSWLPFAVGIPILPVFGWAGATGTLPAAFLVLVPVAVVAGAALAIGNALVDVERDRAAGSSSIAIALGEDRAARIGAALFATVLGAALASAWASGRTGPGLLALAVLGAAPVVAALLARTAESAGRERAWQVEAVGLAGLAIVWLSGLGGSLR